MWSEIEEAGSVAIVRQGESERGECAVRQVDFRVAMLRLQRLGSRGALDLSGLDLGLRNELSLGLYARPRAAHLLA
jgi:hypothetical protein